SLQVLILYYEHSSCVDQLFRTTNHHCFECLKEINFMDMKMTRSFQARLGIVINRFTVENLRIANRDCELSPALLLCCKNIETLYLHGLHHNNILCWTLLECWNEKEK